jgi:hypothetical protein
MSSETLCRTSVIEKSRPNRLERAAEVSAKRGRAQKVKISRKADFLRRPAAPQLWRTSRPVSPFSCVGQGRKGAKERENWNPRFWRPGITLRRSEIFIDIGTEIATSSVGAPYCRPIPTHEFASGELPKRFKATHNKRYLFQSVRMFSRPHVCERPLYAAPMELPPILLIGKL